MIINRKYIFMDLRQEGCTPIEVSLPVDHSIRDVPRQTIENFASEYIGESVTLDDGDAVWGYLFTADGSCVMRVGIDIKSARKVVTDGQ